MKYPSVLIAACLALAPITVPASGPAWEQWVSVPGVFDLGGPQSDGLLVVAGAGTLFTLSADGTATRLPGGADSGAEPYLAVSPGIRLASCEFPRDDIYVLRLNAPIGVTHGTASLANVDLPGLNGIAFDTVGTFGHKLLVTGTVSGKTELVAIDCSGAIQVITKSAPVVEGGMAVAPMSFGIFGGTLIAPDELSGVIWSIGPDGTSHPVVDSGLPKGGDIGVESVAFVPAGFSRGGFVYYSDRATPNNPHPGTDHVLRLSSADLVAAGVKEGDLLAATEGGASMIDVRCDTSCRVTSVVSAPTTAHGEGHIVFTLNPVAPSPHAPPTAAPGRSGRASSPAYLVALFAAFIGALVAALAAVSRRRR